MIKDMKRIFIKWPVMTPKKEQQNTTIVSYTNTNDGDSPPKARVGRPRKLGKLKVTHTIISTGKRRGRPKKSAPTGKRGRPKKNIYQVITKMEQQNTSIESDTNTNDGDSPPKAHVGRPRKLGKLKVTHTIISTGKGRGRPKKALPSLQELKDIIARGEVIVKTKQPRKSKDASGKVGRPKKEILSSDCENEDEIEPPRPVGRPPTGAINLNIVRTGLGQGRPRKLKVSDKRAVSKTQSPHKNGAKRKPGRPSTGGVPYKPTGKPRGRPKKKKEATTANSDDQEEKEQSEGETEALDAAETSATDNMKN
ncbi:chromosomal protein D1-like [Eurosta solidaginis]|uniref:chromosomal protein D1-like n=1 Tax=Eurosta solidaginis TaxID=178769 RepID=UPI0035305711